MIASDVIELLPRARPRAVDGDGGTRATVALRALARVNLAAIERNVARLRAGLAGGARLCAVVKADGYGHGAAAAGARRAGRRRDAGWRSPPPRRPRSCATRGSTAPVLVMGAISAEELPVALGAGAELVAWDERFVDDLRRRRVERPVRRARQARHAAWAGSAPASLAEALAVAERVARRRRGLLRLAGAMTHFATADGDPEFLAAQLAAFAPFVAALRARGAGVVVHAANSAATLREPASHFDMVRCGIAIYGCDPMNVDPGRPRSGAGARAELLRRRGQAGPQPGTAPATGGGSSPSATPGSRRCRSATPTGSAAALTNNCDVLIGGRRYPLAGTGQHGQHHRRPRARSRRSRSATRRS